MSLFPVIPVTTALGGTSQVNVSTLPSGLGNRLEAEMVGPGEWGGEAGGGNVRQSSVLGKEQSHFLSDDPLCVCE